MVFVTEKEKKKELKNNISNYMKLLFRRSVEEATPQQLFQAVSYAVKDIVVDDWMATHKAYEKKDVKTVYYLSMEFLMGRALGNMIINLKEDKVVREVLDEMGVNLDLLEDEEPDAALGNGGLGRLAACFLDSLATLNYLHLVIRLMAVVSATNMVCSSRKSKMVSRLKHRMTG